MLRLAAAGGQSAAGLFTGEGWGGVGGLVGETPLRTT